MLIIPATTVLLILILSLRHNKSKRDETDTFIPQLKQTIEIIKEAKELISWTQTAFGRFFMPALCGLFYWSQPWPSRPATAAPAPTSATATSANFPSPSASSRQKTCALSSPTHRTKNARSPTAPTTASPLHPEQKSRRRRHPQRRPENRKPSAPDRTVSALVATSAGVSQVELLAADGTPGNAYPALAVFLRWCHWVKSWDNFTHNSSQWGKLKLGTPHGSRVFHVCCSGFYGLRYPVYPVVVLLAFCGKPLKTLVDNVQEVLRWRASRNFFTP